MGERKGGRGERVEADEWTHTQAINEGRRARREAGVQRRTKKGRESRRELGWQRVLLSSSGHLAGGGR